MAGSKREEFGVADARPVASVMSWAAIVLVMIVLFPLGLYLTFSKVNYEKIRYHENGKKLIFMGAAFTALTVPVIMLFLVAGANSFAQLIKMIGIPLLFALIGLVSLVSGLIYSRKGSVYDKFLEVIVIDRITDIASVAAATGTTPERAEEVIRELIECDLLIGAYIFKKGGEVIVPGISSKMAYRCGNCGGTAVVYPDGTRECENCGAAV